MINVYKVLERNGVEVENVDDAAFHNAIGAGKNYIIKNVLDECAPSSFNSVVNIGKGTIMIQGIRIKIVSTQTYFFQTIPTNPINYQIIIQIDLDKSRKITVTSFMRSTDDALIQDNLYEEESGTYQVVLSTFTLGSDGKVYNHTLQLPVTYVIPEQDTNGNEGNIIGSQIQKVQILSSEFSKWFYEDIIYEDGTTHSYLATKLDSKYAAIAFVLSLTTNNQILYHTIKKDDGLVLLVGEQQNLLIYAILDNK